MKLADVSIKRPVFATMMILALVVLGLFSLLKLNIDLYPNVDLPFVVVTTALPGAGPEQVESDVTKKIEDAVNPIGGLDHIQSTSQEGVSIVIIQFKLEVNGIQAAQEVRDKIAAIRGEFPTDTKDPIIQRYDPASQPILSLAVSGNRSEREITTFAKDVIKPRIENAQGVGSVELVGGAEREIQVEVGVDRLRAYDLSIQDVIQKVSNSNVEIPGGNLIQGDRQLLLRTMGRYKNVDDFNSVVVATPEDKIVYLSDIAAVVDGTKEQTSLTRVNSSPAVGLDILKQSGSNTVRVADAVKQKLAQLEGELPGDVHVTIASDNSTFIRESVNEVLFDIAYGGLLAVLVIYFFLANIRSTIISAFALPTSIIASFILMYALNFTLNVMTLLALSLAVGLLIDDAIVVIENIYRHMHEGESPMEAAKDATQEIGLAVMATTFTIVAVFVPVAFMPGIVGRFFFQFGITISAAVLVSLFVAFTLTPMLSSRWLRREDEMLSRKGNPLQRFLYYFNHFFEWLNVKYRGALAWSLAHRKTVVFGSIAIFVFTLYLGKYVGSAFFPETDEGQFTVTVRAAPGSSLQQTADICRAIEEAVRARPEVTTVLTTVGAGNDPVTQATVLVKLVSKSERKETVQQIINETRSQMRYVTGADLSFGVPSGPGGGQKPVQLNIRGENMDILESLADKVMTIVRSTPGAVDVESSLETSKPEVRLVIARDKAAELGIDPYLIASSVRSMVDGYVATQYQAGEEQYDVRVRLLKKDRTSLIDVSKLLFKSNIALADGGKLLVPLSTVADISQGLGPSQINRYDRQRSIIVGANLSNALLGNVIADITSRLGQLNIPPGYSVEVIGQGQTQSESFADIFLSLGLAIIFVYIVLAAQFESFVHPLSIMLALPMSVIGAILALLVFGSAFSVMSMIGIIMLMGLATKNGILLVDYTNTMRTRGLDRTDAILRAGPVRLRPILMTSFAIIFGMIPVAFAFGEGSEFRAPMGQAVIGGMITSTLLTLFIVPVVYTLLDDISPRRLLTVTKKLLSRVNFQSRSSDETA